MKKNGTPTTRLRLRITLGDVIAIGPGKVDLLEALRAQGSISGAARSLGMSYRRAWLLLSELNQSLKGPAFVTSQGGQQGGGAQLTATGEALIRHYRAFEAEALSAGAPQMAQLLRLLKKS
jgi:molybdate transport system regulatory protein